MTSRTNALALVALTLAATTIAAGCKSGDDKTCTPGAQVACDCPSGAKSVQLCNSEGSGLGACQCGGAPGSELGVKPGDGGGPLGDGAAGPCAWPGTQKGERFHGWLLLDPQDNLYIFSPSVGSSHHYPTRIDCRTGQITEQMIPFDDPGWSSGKALPINVQSVGDHFLVAFAPDQTEEPPPDGALVIYDSAWRQVATLTSPRDPAELYAPSVFVDPRDSTFYAVPLLDVFSHLDHFDKSGKLIATYPQPGCNPYAPAPKGNYCADNGNSHLVPRLFHQGQVTDLPGFANLSTYQQGSPEAGFKILGHTQSYGLIVTYGDNTSITKGWFKIELRDPDGTITWTSTTIDHVWAQIHNTLYIWRGYVDPAGDVIVVGRTPTGLPGKPSVSKAFYIMKLSRASSSVLWTYQSPDQTLLPSTVMTSRGEIIHAANSTSDLKMFDTSGNEVGPRPGGGGTPP